MKILFPIILIVLSATMMLMSKAHATKNVSGPKITEGSLLAELRSGLEFDDRASRDRRIGQQLFVDYGLSDRVATRLSSYGSKPDGQDYHLTGLGTELRYEILEPEDSWLNLATRLRYVHQKGASNADVVSLALLGQTSYDEWVFTGNAQLSEQIGGGRTSGTSAALAAQALYQWDKQLAMGGEWFGNLGNLSRQSGYDAQQHQFGPVVKLNAGSNAFQLGYLRGISHGASDSLVKFFVTQRF